MVRHTDRTQIRTSHGHIGMTSYRPRTTMLPGEANLLDLIDAVEVVARTVTVVVVVDRWEMQKRHSYGYHQPWECWTV